MRSQVVGWYLRQPDGCADVREAHRDVRYGDLVLRSSRVGLSGGGNADAAATAGTPARSARQAGVLVRRSSGHGRQRPEADQLSAVVQTVNHNEPRYPCIVLLLSRS